MQLAAQARPTQRVVVTGPKDADLRLARSCYDHIAGRLGVALSDHLVERGAIKFDDARVACSARLLISNSS